MGKSTEEMIGRAVIDPAFRKRLLADPDGTVKAEGYEVSKDVLDKIKAVDPAAAEAAIEGMSGEATRQAGA